MADEKQQDMGASLRDRASQASPQAPADLGHSVTIPCAADKYDPRNHPPGCAYHVDQYPWECTCGRI